jgi:phosphoenolpyruvate carboxykinase (diphosphate)
LGYRITQRFVHAYFGRVFDNPVAVFSEELLRPETQDLAVFVDGIENLVDAQQKSALAYFKDGSIEHACPPLKAVLHLMAYGHYEGRSVSDPDLRALFTRESLLGSSWYKARLLVKQDREVLLWRRHVTALERFMLRPAYESEAARLGIAGRLAHARAELERVSGPLYLQELVGTLGADPILAKYAPEISTESGRFEDLHAMN